MFLPKLFVGSFFGSCIVRNVYIENILIENFDGSNSVETRNNCWRYRRQLQGQENKQEIRKGVRAAAIHVQDFKFMNKMNKRFPIIIGLE